MTPRMLPPRSPSVRRRALLPLAALVLLGAARAQAPDSQLQRDIEFVRDLANRLGFISLAQSEADRMKLRYKDSADARSIDMLGVEISLIGAKILPNQDEKRALYAEAIDRCQQILRATDEGPTALTARITLADAALEFGRFLADEIEIARAEEPERVPELEEQAAEVFRRGEDAADAAMKQLAVEARSDPDARVRYHLAWMNKGILLREHARAIKEDRVYLAGRSREVLEELVFETGEETALGQRAMFEYAMNDEVLGNYDSAVMSYRDVISSADYALTDENLQLPREVRELMVITLEEAYERIAATRLEQGRVDDVVQTMQEYRDHLQRLGVPVVDLDDPQPGQGNEDSRFGHGLYLAAARAMAETGEPDQVARGLKLAQFVSDQHQNDFVGMRARVVLKDILDRQSQRVSGVLLLDAAKGDYQAKNYEAAIKGIKHALAAMTPQELQSNGLDAVWHLGHSLALQKRELEATLALKRGLEEYGAGAEDAQKERVTSLMQRAMRNVLIYSNNAEAFDRLDQEIADLAARYGSVADAAKRYWNEGLRLMSENRWDDAVRAFRRIEKESAYYELAQARIASSLQRKGDFEAAREVITDYRDWLRTDEASIPSDRPELQQSREIAQGEMAFAEAYMLYLEGVGRDGSGTGDPTKFPHVVTLLSDFESQHGNQHPNLVPVVHYLLGRSYAEMGKLDKAEAEYRTLQREYPGHSNVALLATALFSAYHEQIKAKTTEVEALHKQGDSRVSKAEEELTALRRKLVALGTEYFENAEDPQYGIAYLTLDQAAEIASEAQGDAAQQAWAKVESLGNKVVQTFGDRSDVAEKVDKFVRPMVGDAMLRQKKFREAYDMLVEAEKASPSNYPIKRMICLALGGWQEIDRFGKIQNYRGLGRPAEAYQKYWGEYRTYALNPNRGVERYSLPWYRFHWECYNFAREAARSDSVFQSRARSLYGTAESTDDFDTLRNLGPEGEELWQLFKANPPR